MSARFNIALTFGVLAVMLLTSVTIIYFTRQGVQQSEDNNKDIAEIKSENAELKKILTDFVNMWTERIQIGNNNTNTTQQLIIQGQKNIIGNLSSHRIVTNETFDHIQEILNKTNTLTDESYAKLADQRTNRIIGNLSEDHEIIFKALNITKNDKETDAETDIAKLKQAIEELQNKTS